MESLNTKEELEFWKTMHVFTDARIGLGHTGISIPLKEVLDFRLAHAHARDAVYSKLEIEKLSGELSKLNFDYLHLHSQAENRDIYLKRPDFGRRLSSESLQKLNEVNVRKGYDFIIVAGDGLSAKAINENLVPLLKNLYKLNFQTAKFSIGPIILVENARVAVGDEIGEILQAKIVVQLIGERPGLKAFDSMGAYITYAPKVGITDEVRNCISNIRPGGLNIETAAKKILYIIQEAFALKLTGVKLKDNYLDNSSIDTNIISLE